MGIEIHSNILIFRMKHFAFYRTQSEADKVTLIFYNTIKLIYDAE